MLARYKYKISTGKTDGDCANPKELFRAVFFEFLATALFVFYGTGCAISVQYQDGVPTLLPIAMAFGMSIMLLAYAIGNFSGGHINPAVTFMMFLIGKNSALRSSLYVAVQLFGAVIGSLLLWSCTDQLSKTDGVGSPPYLLGANTLNKDLTAGNGFAFETIGTFTLCVVVALTAVRAGGPSDGKPNLAPLCIGFTVFVVHLVLIPFTGCGINVSMPPLVPRPLCPSLSIIFILLLYLHLHLQPARTFGPAVVDAIGGKGDAVWLDSSWIYYIGPLLGAAAAAALHLMLPLDFPLSETGGTNDNSHIFRDESFRLDESDVTEHMDESYESPRKDNGFATSFTTKG